MAEQLFSYLFSFSQRQPHKTGVEPLHSGQSPENMPESDEKKLTAVEEQLAALKEELEVAKVAKKVGEAVEELFQHSEKQDEPFDKVVDEPNEWHKNPGGGGGCIIL